MWEVVRSWVGVFKGHEVKLVNRSLKQVVWQSHSSSHSNPAKCHKRWRRRVLAHMRERRGVFAHMQALYPLVNECRQRVCALVASSHLLYVSDYSSTIKVYGTHHLSTSCLIPAHLSIP